MILAYVVALVTIATAFVNAATVPESAACHKVDSSGFFSSFFGSMWLSTLPGWVEINLTPDPGRNQALDLNSNKELTVGSGTAFKAEFQVSDVKCADCMRFDSNFRH
jgi:hypothetical protein